VQPKIGDDSGNVRQYFDRSNPHGFDGISVRVQVRVHSFASRERNRKINDLRSKFESSLRTRKISEDKLQKVLIRRRLDKDLVHAHGTAEFSTLLWGIKELI